MAGSSWNTFVASTTISSAEVNENFDWLEGDIAPQSNGVLASDQFNLGSTTARFLNANLGGELYKGNTSTAMYIANCNTNLPLYDQDAAIAIPASPGDFTTSTVNTVTIELPDEVDISNIAIKARYYLFKYTGSGTINMIFKSTLLRKQDQTTTVNTIAMAAFTTTIAITGATQTYTAAVETSGSATLPIPTYTTIDNSGYRYYINNYVLVNLSNGAGFTSGSFELEKTTVNWE